ncbi:MAG TPA: glycosyltransferase [Planctomycetota bacterium]|nr:glycosyltransferase [Planctomycetota bacterium]
MKILYLSDILNIHDERLLTQFRGAGHDVTLLTFFHRAPELPKFVRDLKVIHERYATYPDGAGASRWRLIRAVEYRRDEARACLKIKDVLRQNRFDVVFANWALTSGYVAAHAGARPLALFPWGSDILVWPKLHRGFAERAVKALRTADLVVCNSKTAAEEAKRLARLRPDRVEVLPIELDAARFEPRPRNDELRAHWGLGDRAVVLSTRPLKELYDHPTLLAALARPGMEKFAAVFVGDGNLRADLERKAQDLKVADRVRFVGLVENERIPEYLAAADLYVTCSRSDSASLGLLEAMAMAIPVVASDIPANREWVAPGQSGWLFPVGDSEALAGALSAAMADDKNRQEVALRGRAIALARADSRKNFPKLLARIEALAHAPRVRS